MQTDQLFQNIRTIRESIGMTQEELAQKIGYSGKSMVSKLEAGCVDPSHSRIYAIAEALGVSYGDLMGWESKAAKEGVLSKGIAIPVYDAVFPDQEKKQKDHIIGFEPISAAWAGDYFGLLLKEDLKDGPFASGDILIIRKQETAKNDALVLAWNKKKQPVIRRFVKLRNTAFLLPLKETASSHLAVAEKSFPRDPFRIIGCIVETRRRH